MKFVFPIVAQRLLRYETAVLDGRPLEAWPGDDTSVPNLVVSYRKALLAVHAEDVKGMKGNCK